MDAFFGYNHIQIAKEDEVYINQGAYVILQQNTSNLSKISSKDDMGSI